MAEKFDSPVNVIVVLSALECGAFDFVLPPLNAKG